MRYHRQAYWPCRGLDGQRYFATVRTELPITPTPAVFLQPRTFCMAPLGADERASKVCTGLLIRLVLDWRDKGPRPIDADEFPIALSDIIREHSPWKLPTDTQLVDLVTKVAAETDYISKALYFLPSLDTVFITNPSALGGDKPLSFKLCPFALGMESELPHKSFKQILARRTMALFILSLATNLSDLTDTRLVQMLPSAFNKSPGLVTAFMELWHVSKPEARHAPDEGALSMMMHYTTPALPPYSSPTTSAAVEPPDDATMVACSATMRTLNEVRSRTPRDFAVEQVPGLLTAMTCHHSPTIHSLATDGLWRLLLGATKPHHAEAIGIITTCAPIVVPSGLTGLIDPSSSHKSANWIQRLNVLDRCLIENERSGDYARLRRLQQALLSAGIGQHLGGSLAGVQGSFTLKVLVPVVKLSASAWVHFPILRTRLIFDRNVRKMAKMLVDATNRKDLDAADRDRVVLMMLVMSDFMAWANQPTALGVPDDAPWMRMWDEVDEEVFLLRGLPCWHAQLSDATTASMVRKLERALDKAVAAFEQSAPGAPRDALTKKLSYILDWLTHFAWNSVEQVTAASFQSLYTAHFLALIFRKPGHAVYHEVPARKKPFALADLPSTAGDHRQEPRYVRPRLLLDALDPSSSAAVQPPRTTGTLDDLDAEEVASEEDNLSTGSTDVDATQPAPSTMASSAVSDARFRKPDANVWAAIPCAGTGGSHESRQSTGGAAHLQIRARPAQPVRLRPDAPGLVRLQTLCARSGRARRARVGRPVLSANSGRHRGRRVSPVHATAAQHRAARRRRTRAVRRRRALPQRAQFAGQRVACAPGAPFYAHDAGRQESPAVSHAWRLRGRHHGHGRVAPRGFGRHERRGRRHHVGHARRP